MINTKNGSLSKLHSKSRALLSDSKHSSLKNYDKNYSSLISYSSNKPIRCY